MAVVGGDLLEIRISHETVGNFVLWAKSNESATRDLGGYRNVDDANMVDGGGRMIMIKNQNRWSIECMISDDMNVARDLESLVAFAESPIEGNITFTWANGVTEGGTGTVVGDIQSDTNTATSTVKFAGAGKLKQL